MPNQVQNQDNRNERRRIADRDAQRASRARTKKRIEELESLVESLYASQGDERVKVLSQQLQEQREENKSLSASLTNIHKIVNSSLNHGSSKTVESSSPSENNNKSPKSSCYISDSISGSPTQALESPACSIMLRKHDYETSLNGLVSINPLETIIQETSISKLLPGNSIVNPTDTQISRHDLVQLVLPSKMSQRMAWEIVNSAITAAIQQMIQEPQVDTQLDTDIIHTAIFQGWAEAEKRYHLDVSWMLSQQIDQYLFFQCCPITRLAILYTMRLSFLQKTNSLQAHSTIPDYLRPRMASKLVDHPVLVDFFVWPDIRDHMLLSPSIYIPNRFVKLFSKNVKFLWTESISDVCVLNLDTGRHDFSPSFNERFNNIGSWTLSIDFFLQYPKLIGMIPIYNALPRSLQAQVPLEMNPAVSFTRDGENRDADSWMVDIPSYIQM